MPLYTGLVQGNAETEASYVNVLLTTLAKGPVASIALMPGIGAPSLIPFASSADEQQWIESYHFNYERLDATKIVALILTLAGWRFYHFLKTDYTLKTILAMPGGEERHVTFAVKRISRMPAAPITVTRHEGSDPRAA